MISADELAAIRELGETGMVTPIEIHRPTALVEDTSAPGYDPDSDYGDDIVEDPEGTSPTTKVADALGWFYSRLQQDVTQADGQIATIDIHVLRLPVGTDIQPRDVVIRTEDGSKYLVIDTNADDTWAEELKVNVRRAE